jgi:solute carrier family 35 protein C2
MFENLIVISVLGSFLAVSLIINIFIRLVIQFDLKFNDRLIFEQHHVFLTITSFAFLWFSISLSFTLYNKWLLQVWANGFNYPIILTSIHMVVKMVATRIWSCTPLSVSVKPLTNRIFIFIIVPIGILTSMDIVLSNAAISILPLSIYTTIKGSTLIFTYLWCLLLGIEKFSFSVLIAVISICLGIGAAVFNTLDADALGVVYSVGSAACGGLRWVLLQMLVDVDSSSKNVMITLYRFTPPSVVAVVPVALVLELPRLIQSSFLSRDNHNMLLETFLLASVGGVISLLLIGVEVRLLQLTSSLSMGVLGQTKEILQILTAMLVYKDAISVRSAAGISVSILASLYYKHVKNGERQVPVLDSPSEIYSLVKNGEHDDDGDDHDQRSLMSTQVHSGVITILERKHMMPMHIATVNTSNHA